jgi:type I restriction enzyme M protein
MRNYRYEEFTNRDLLAQRRSLEHSANLPAPDIIAAEIVEDLQAALEQFSEIAFDLSSKESGDNFE